MKRITTDGIRRQENGEKQRFLVFPAVLNLTKSAYTHFVLSKWADDIWQNGIFPTTGKLPAAHPFSPLSTIDIFPTF